VRLDPDALRRLAAMEGRVIGLELRGLELRLYLLPGADGIQVLGSYEDEPDTWLSGAPLSMMRLGLGRSPMGTLLAGDVEIRGDADLGRRFKEILDGIAIDWEEPLARVTGDVVAHQLGNLARGAREWGRRAAEGLASDLGEYLQEERRELPSRAEVEVFLDGVDRLRIDTERLEARVARLRRWLDARDEG
jgi:ubiquinone biosynthesis accessory factor UbiJ